MRREPQPDKGHYNGSCNREACQKAGAIWYNRSTRAYYCAECAMSINSYHHDVQPPLCSRGEHEDGE
jgi:hypothetical protein